VIPDIRPVEGGHQCRDQFGVAVAQIEDPAVDVQINVPSPVGIEDIGALPFANDQIDADLPEGVDFSRAHEFPRHFYNFTFFHDALPQQKFRSLACRIL
jgi:hypothetical protein